MRSPWYDPQPMMKLTVSGFDAELIPIQLHGCERLGYPYRYRVRLLCPLIKSEFDKCIGKDAVLALQDPYLTTPRYFTGFINYLGQTKRGYQLKGKYYQEYYMELWPQFMHTLRSEDFDIFHDKTLLEIMKETLTAYQESDCDFSRIRGDYPVLEHKVRYGERAFHFLSRLMEWHGIFYTFTHNDQGQILHFMDSVDSLFPCPIAALEPAGTRHLKDRGICQNRFRVGAMGFGHVMTSDYDFKRPDNPIKGHWQVAGYRLPRSELYNIGATSDAHANHLARVWGESRRYGECLGLGRSYYRCLMPGMKFKYAKANDQLESLNDAYLTKVWHRAIDYYPLRQLGIKLDNDKLAKTGYSNRFEAMPITQTYRTPQDTPVSELGGVYPAKVTGPEAGKVFTDKWARVKLRFPWDKKGQNSKWARVVQRWAGNNMGSLFIPKVGDEVWVMYVYGSPDEPMVIRSAPNGTNRPFNNPEEAFVSGFRTVHNEFTFDDTPGKEQVNIKTDGDYVAFIKNNLIETVGNDQNIKVDGNMVTKILNGKCDWQANRFEFQVGPSKMIIDKDEGITFEAPKVTILADGSDEVEGAARLGDDHTCPKMQAFSPHKGGPVTQGSPNVFINGRPAARVNDQLHCRGDSDVIIKGASNVFINGRPAARLNDQTKHGGVIKTSASNVFIGSGPRAPSISSAGGGDDLKKCLYPTVKIDLTEKMPTISLPPRVSKKGDLVYVMRLKLLGDLNLQKESNCNYITLKKNGYKLEAKELFSEILEDTKLSSLTAKKVAIKIPSIGDMYSTELSTSEPNTLIFTAEPAKVDSEYKSWEIIGNMGYQLKITIIKRHNSTNKKEIIDAIVFSNDMLPAIIASIATVVFGSVLREAILALPEADLALIAS